MNWDDFLSPETRDGIEALPDDQRDKAVAALQDVVDGLEEARLTLSREDYEQFLLSMSAMVGLMHPRNEN